jgi:hypothetical protein
MTRKTMQTVPSSAASHKVSVNAFNNIVASPVKIDPVIL